MVRGRERDAAAWRRSLGEGGTAIESEREMRDGV